MSIPWQAFVRENRMNLFSLVFSALNPSSRTLAVDPSPMAFQRLLYNVHKNPAMNITPVECALSDATGAIHMHYEGEHAVACEALRGAAKGLCVQMATGDSLCATHSFAPDVIKIDVEGHEVKVLKGLRKSLEHTRPLLFLELHPAAILAEGDRLEDLAEILSDYRYTAFVGNRDVPVRESLAGIGSGQRLYFHAAGT